jgi:predicted N-formylglutamate amidohydrolase
VSARIELVVSCEHASNVVPAKYRHLFEGREDVLDTHRGYDPGTRELGRRLARALRAPIILARYTRLLVELNRSTHHRALFSEFSRRLSRAERRRVLERFYHPHRQAVERAIRAKLRSRGPVLHLGVHSFTPVLAGRRRNADIGLLYDPKRRHEAALCRRWQDALRSHDARLRVRRNYPYRGDADGLTAYLRTVFPQRRYMGVELEINQSLSLGTRTRWAALQESLTTTLASVLPLK